MSSVSTQYQFTKDDYVAFYNHVMWSSGAKKKERINNILKTFGNVVVFGAIVYYGTSKTLPLKLIPAILILVVGISLLSIFLFKNKLDNNLETFLQNEDNANIFTLTYLFANEKELTLRNEFEQTTYQWKSIINKIELDTHYFLFTNAVQAIIIPKKAFINNDDKIAFDKILSTTLPLEVQLKQDIRHGGK